MPIGNKEKLNFTQGWKPPKKKFSLHSSMAHFSLWLGVHLLLALPGGLSSGVSSAPCNIKVPHTALPHAMLRCTSSVLAWHPSSSPQVTWPRLGQLILPTCSQQPQLSQLPIPFLALLLFLQQAHFQKALLQWKEHSPALQSRLSTAGTKHRQELNNISWVKSGEYMWQGTAGDGCLLGTGQIKPKLFSR